MEMNIWIWMNIYIRDFFVFKFCKVVGWAFWECSFVVYGLGLVEDVGVIYKIIGCLSRKGFWVILVRGFLYRRFTEGE